MRVSFFRLSQETFKKKTLNKSKRLCHFFAFFASGFWKFESSASFKAWTFKRLKARLKPSPPMPRMGCAMSNVVPHPAFATREPAQAPTADQTEAFFDTCLRRFRNRHTTRSLTPEYTEKCLGSLRDLMTWAGKPLVALEEADYDTWCTELFKIRKLKRSTRRTYQKHMRQVI